MKDVKILKSSELSIAKEMGFTISTHIDDIAQALPELFGGYSPESDEAQIIANNCRWVRCRLEQYDKRGIQIREETTPPGIVQGTYAFARRLFGFGEREQSGAEQLKALEERLLSPGSPSEAEFEKVYDALAAPYNHVHVQVGEGVTKSKERCDLGRHEAPINPTESRAIDGPSRFEAVPVDKWDLFKERWARKDRALFTDLQCNPGWQQCVRGGLAGEHSRVNTLDSLKEALDLLERFPFHFRSQNGLLGTLFFIRENWNWITQWADRLSQKNRISRHYWETQGKKIVKIPGSYSRRCQKPDFFPLHTIALRREKGSWKVVFIQTKLDKGSYKEVKLLCDFGQKACVAVSKQSAKDKNEEIALTQKCKGLPNVIQLMEVSYYQTRKGTTALVTRTHFFNQANLEQWLRRTNRAESPQFTLQKLQIALQICEGITQIHSQGIVHRDLKPDNIFLENTNSQEGHPPHVVVADLGLACRMDLHRPLEDAGTPIYMPPEVLEQNFDMLVGESPESYGKKRDGWALGLILHRLFKGGLPYATTEEKLNRIQTREELKQALCSYEHNSSSSRPRNRDSIDYLIWKLTRRNPNERWSAEEAKPTLEWLLRTRTNGQAGRGQRMGFPSS